MSRYNRDNMWQFLLVVIVGVALAPSAHALICSRRPANTGTAKSPVDENYVISISGNPETYILGQSYNVSLSAYNGRRYISFILALENENGDFNYMDDLGRFELNDQIETRFSPHCINLVENTNTNPKIHSHVTWIAPSEPGSGCILIRATLLQHRDVWHMDDGGLTRRICEEIVDDVESQPMAMAVDSSCCACDEARYELIFEGAWSRNLHPKDFPARGWETRFCELLGAAHTADYRFWEYGALASEGMKQYAQHGASRQLEREFSLNFRNQKIRTIIKARGPAYPNLNGKSVSSVRVDALRHMLSFASKIEPSPDWIVGVSGLELCLRNCTWLEQKVINLYPWDVGTDAGPSYTSPDQPQVPPDVIRRMRSDFPNDPRSPFYNEDGAPMKPMAVLTLRRQRIYERRCADEESNNELELPRECLTHPWSSWSDCSSKCGEGMQFKRRVYKQPELAKIYSCNVPQYEERPCQGQACGLGESMRQLDNYDELGVAGAAAGAAFGKQQRRAECQVSAWSAWSACSVTCGAGFQMRQRQYINPGAELNCQGVHPLQLEETVPCKGRACLGNLPGAGQQDYDEPASEYNQQSGFEVGDLKGVSSKWNPVQPQSSPRGQYGQQKQQQAYKSSSAIEFAPHLEDVERAPWQQPAPSDNYNNNMGGYNNNNKNNMGDSDVDPSGGSARCFWKLQTSRCHDQRVVGHFWFYNYCADECMLVAADICDRNVNKFTKWEACEQNCRQAAALASFLQQRQNSPECQMNQRQPEQQPNFDARRDNYGYRQRG